MMYGPQWIRVAGNARAIKDGSKAAWRVFLEDGTRIELTAFEQRGEAVRDNCRFRTVIDHPDVANGLSAWIDMYGTFSVEDSAGILELRRPA